VGVGSILRTRAAFFFAARKPLVAEGIEVAVAITRLAKHESSISLFVRFVNNYIRFLFAHASRMPRS
jgi:cyclopropane fatty-acyl-phospholipid synthase-like methyltransferase